MIIYNKSAKGRLALPFGWQTCR